MTTITGIAQQILDENGYHKDTSSVNVTAQNILDENKWTIANITLTNLELVMDNAIIYVNLEANTTIQTMTGAADSKIVTLTKSEALAVKTLSAMMVRAYLDKGPNIGIQSISVIEVINDPHYTLFSGIFQQSVNLLKTASPIFVEALITNAIDLINFYADITISQLSGTTGTKSLTAQRKELLTVKFVTSGFLKEYRASGQTKFSLGGTAKELVELLKEEEGEEIEVDIG